MLSLAADETRVVSEVILLIISPDLFWSKYSMSFLIMLQQLGRVQPVNLLAVASGKPKSGAAGVPAQFKKDEKFCEI